MDADGRIKRAKRVDNDTRTVELKFEHILGPPVFPKRIPKWDPIHDAATWGQVDAIEALAERNPRCLNARVRGEQVYHDDHRAHTFTPIMLAAYAGRDKALAKLLELGANPHLHVERPEAYGGLLDNHGGYTAVHWACLRQNDAALKLLLAAGADPTAQSDRSETALMVAVKHGAYGCAELLMSHVPAEKRLAFLNAQDTWQSKCGRRTALHYAASKGHPRMAELLLRWGADPMFCDNGERTPLDLVTPRNGRWMSIQDLDCADLLRAAMELHDARATVLAKEAAFENLTRGIAQREAAAAARRAEKPAVKLALEEPRWELA